MAMLQSVIAGGGNLEDSKEVLNYIKNYNRNRTLDEVVEILKKTKTTYEDDMGNDCWYIDELENIINQLKSE